MLHANMRSATAGIDASFVALAIAGWAPLAFFAVVEILSRMPAGRSFASLIRYFAAAVVGGVAAWISYWHMVKVADHYGELSPHLLPLSVDGLIVVSSMCLVELTRLRTRPAAAQPVEADPEPTAEPGPASEPPAIEQATPVVVIERTPASAAPTVTSTVVPSRPARPQTAHAKPRRSGRGVDAGRRDGLVADVIAGKRTPREVATAEGVTERAVQLWVKAYRERPTTTDFVDTPTPDRPIPLGPYTPPDQPEQPAINGATPEGVHA